MEKDMKKRARNRERQALRRAMETEEERSLRLEASRKYSAEKRANESEEKRAERRLVDRKRAAERRARETRWEREHRLAIGRHRAAERRACETEEIRECRLAQNRVRLASKRALKADRAPVNGEFAIENRRRKSQLVNGHCDSKAGPKCNGAGHVAVSLPVVDIDISVEDEMANAQQQRAPEPVVATSGGGGEEKSGEVKQEIVEIKEFRAVEPNLERHYNELLKVISEIGRDVKPAYTNNKVSTDRLRKNIMMARGIVRECVQDVDRLSVVATSSSSNSL